MGRKRRDEDQLSEDNATPADNAEGADDTEAKSRKRRGRKLVLLAALAGAATYLVRRNQRKAELDEGIWHEAPTAPATPQHSHRPDRRMTRSIVAGLFISLDGVVEEPGDWHFPYFNDEMGAAVGADLGAADTLLLGRKTYDSFAGAWPEREAEGGEDAEFAKVARRHAQDRRVAPAAGVHLAELRAARGRPRPGRDRPEEPAR